MSIRLKMCLALAASLTLVACGDDMPMSYPDLSTPEMQNPDMSMHKPPASSDGGTQPDLATYPDLAAHPDLAEIPDLAQPPHVCAGVISCADNILQSDCEQAGCTYSPDACTGIANSCSFEVDDFMCGQQSGCTWDSISNICTGIAESCDQVGTSGCWHQSGCSLSTAHCSGPTLKTCASFTDQLSCELTRNCKWQ